MRTQQNRIKANAYAFICMIICICSSTTTYACIAYACKHIRAWHVCTYICLHGMHAYMQASCHMHLHTTPTGGGGTSSHTPAPHPTYHRGRGGGKCQSQPFTLYSNTPPTYHRGGDPFPLVGGGGGEPVWQRWSGIVTRSLVQHLSAGVTCCSEPCSELVCCCPAR